MRLDKLLSENGYGSKRQVKRLLFSKQVCVDGQIVMIENLTVDPTIQTITVCGKKVIAQPNVYYMLNKPQGVISAVKDTKKKTVVDLLHPSDYKDTIFPVGRLDADTTGLLLLTNNGRLAYHMLHPKFHVEKQYDVIVNGELNQHAVEKFQQGITFLDGTTCQSAKLTILKQASHHSRAVVTIKEGKFHQIKKMFLSVGVKVIGLKRISFGPLHLDETLQLGEYRPLNSDELKQLTSYFK